MVICLNVLYICLITTDLLIALITLFMDHRLASLCLFDPFYPFHHRPALVNSLHLVMWEENATHKQSGVFSRLLENQNAPDWKNLCNTDRGHAGLMQARLS